MNSILNSPDRLIKRHGKQVSYTKAGEGTYNPATSSYTASGAVTSTVYAYKMLTSYRDSQQPNLINKESATYLIPATGFTEKPKAGDTITDGDDVYEVMMVSDVQAKGQTAMYRVVVVRA